MTAAPPLGALLPTATASRQRSPQPSIRTLLLGLLLTCMVPGLVGVGFLMYRSYEDGRRQIEQDTLRTARALVKVVDGQIDAARIVAVALSTSSFVANADWEGFHRRASELLKIEDVGTSVVIGDPSGQQLVNTTVPWGTPLRKTVLTEETRRFFEDPKIVVTRMFPGAMSGKLRFAIVAPVRAGSKVAYSLGVSIDTGQLEKLLLEQRLPAEWVSSISDETGSIAARSLDNQKYAGKPVNPEISSRLLTAPEAAFETVTKEGVPALVVASRSPASGWTVSIAIPLATLQADLKRNLLLLGVGSLLLFATGGWLAQGLARRIAGSVQTLAESAKVLARGGEWVAEDAGFREADEAGRALQRAGQLLLERAQALSDSHATLLEREAALAEAQTIARIGSWSWDASTDVTTCSVEMCRIFGRQTIPPLAGQSGTMYPREAWQRLNAASQGATRTGTGYDLELPALRADGTAFWVEARAEAIRSANGELLGLRGTVQDITDRKRAEENAARMSAIEAENRHLLEASRLKSQFLANMSHELRTPLNAVIGFADLLHSGYVKPDSPNHQLYLGHIGTSGRHLLQLINDVLDLSKVESGKFDFYPERLDLRELLKEVGDILHTAITRKHIRLTMDVDTDLVDVTLDPARLKQVLYNYLSNAIKFTGEGGRITVRALSQGPEHFRIEVQDTGIGISAADLPRLFSEFLQLNSGYSKQHQGTGLGLALTRRLVHLQGGEVGVRSTLGVGSVFTVVLNRIHGVDTRRSESPAEQEARRVLVIEDDLRDRALIVQALSQAGFAVDTATDDKEAARRAREMPYAAMTLDLGVRERRGLDLLDEIRSQGASHASPVLGVAMPSESNLSAVFAIANVLCKPIRSDEILSAMSRFREPGGRRARVMVIDDEEASLDLMQATLRSLDIDADCFQDGRLALQSIESKLPDAIVLDLMMPEFDGFQVLDALQSLPALREVPVFIWTSMLLTDDEYAKLARSARAILIKGGGAIETMLDSLRRWRPPVTPELGVRP